MGIEESTTQGMFISDIDRKIYEMIIDDSKVEDLLAELENDLIELAKTDFEENDWVQIYNEELPNPMDEDKPDLEVNVWMKDEYYDDNKFTKEYHTFDIIGMFPKNHFFF